MKITALAAILLTLTSSSYAFELPALKSADIKAAETAVPAPVAAPVVSAEKQHQNLWMRVNSNPSWREAEADDFSLAIEVRVRKVFDTMFDAYVHVDNRSEFVHLSKFGRGFSLSGSGMNLNMSEWGGNYSVSGGVTGDDNQYKHINVTLHQRFYNSARYFYITAYGINLDFGPGGVNGSYDDKEYSKKAVAAIITMALAAHVDGMPAQKSEEKAGERIWLTYRNTSMGWNQMEASDPFADIEIGLRKVFNKEYDAEIEVGGDRESGRVSNFFSRTWEYRGRSADLRLEEWGGSYALKGELQTMGAAAEVIKVNLRVSPAFGPGSFSITENGIRLMSDRNGVNAEVDTKIYPKKLVAVIAAISMAMQQQAYNPNQD